MAEAVVSQKRSVPWKWPILIGGVLAVALPLAVAPSVYPEFTSADFVGYALRVTARVAGALFLLAYIARPLVQLYGVGSSLVRHRRYLGIAAAIAHTVHAAYLVVLFRALGEWPDLITLVFGGFAFVLFWAMALTSNDAAMRALGSRWKTLHRTGIHYIWFIFLQTWAGRVTGEPIYVAITLAFVLAAVLRFRAWRVTRRP